MSLEREILWMVCFFFHIIIANTKTVLGPGTTSMAAKELRRRRPLLSTRLRAAGASPRALRATRGRRPSLPCLQRRSDLSFRPGPTGRSGRPFHRILLETRADFVQTSAEKTRFFNNVTRKRNRKYLSPHHTNNSLSYLSPKGKKCKVFL